MKKRWMSKLVSLSTDSGLTAAGCSTLLESMTVSL